MKHQPRSHTTWIVVPSSSTPASPVCWPLVPRLRRSPFAGAFLDGVNAASLALMAVVAWQLGRGALTDWLTLLLALVSGLLLLRFRVNSAWLVLGGALAGLGASWLRS